MWSSRILLCLLTFAVTLKITNSNQCLTFLEEINPKRTVYVNGQSLSIQFELTQRIPQRIITRIMKIFLQEVLGYARVATVERDDRFDAPSTFARLSENHSYSGYSIIPETMVNMEVWIPPHLDTMPLLNEYSVKECGAVAPPGHFGWFIPFRLPGCDDNWMTFTKLESASRFDVNDINLNKIINYTINPDTNEFYCQESFCDHGMYIPEQCYSSANKLKPQPCAMLLADYPGAMNFVKSHIDKLKLYVKVAWVGPNLKYLIKYLTKEYLSQNSAPLQRCLVILHWSPSNVIPNESEFITVDFPRCGARGLDVGCAYETQKLVKLAWSKLEISAKLAFDAINRAKFTRNMYEDIINRYSRNNKTLAAEEQIACDWLKDYINYTMSVWKPNNEDKNSLIIGGIFPMTGNFYTAKSIVLAAKMAKQAINDNSTVLRDYNLTLLASDGQCNSDMVLKSFIDYFGHNYFERLIGILGPACSETIEPLVGVSKHYKTLIISYSAEGSNFDDRNKYPYFFRTIGENRQYKYVYSQLLKEFGWHRVAAFSEDGLKYTEYISYMEEMLREYDIHFVANIKFPRDWEPEIITKYLVDLKQRRAKIIIADTNDQVARLVMCEAYLLEMTAAQGYVWFLPLWLKPQWYDSDYYNKRGEKTPCTTAELKKAINGHLGISHSNFAPDDSIMQEGITVRQWRERYERFCASQHEVPSNYAGYTYDAMWTYALAMDLLLKENESYVFDLHSEKTANRLTHLISQTDFNGVSGRIKFVGGPSRFPVIKIVQLIDEEFREIGSFHPNISETTNEVTGGNLKLNMSALVWLSGTMPTDGSVSQKKCVLSGMAEFLDVSCEDAIVITNIIGFGLLGILLIVGVFVLKRKYEKKVRLQEDYMKSLGLELLKQDNSSLDKWEIPRDKVVINRKIGEGAFGNVYGGEAYFPEKGWLAVAVKTLKVGSSTDEKLDFLSEVEVMKQFEHQNIIKLLAVCIKCEPVLTVMEFMLYGDLKTYLLARRHLVNDHNYEDSDEISNKKLTAMAMDVARALSYLAQLKYVHRDVASRNCLVNAQRIVKLGDFGMTRPMYENDYYKFNRKGMLPVRWMAPESLGLGIFTPASDVWSYGVLLYEIITFGSFPFQGMSNNQVLAHVKLGNSLTVPKGVKPQLEGLIRSCWSVQHTKRPTAPEIVDFLATNPRVLSPCLDVPLSSVQLEHTGQMEMQIDQQMDRKFSFPLSWPAQSTSRSGVKNVPVEEPPLLVLNDVAIQEDEKHMNSILVQHTSDSDSSKPLLESPINCSSLSDTDVRYVNLQPGRENFLDALTSDSNSCNIALRDKGPVTSDTRKFNVSFL